MGKPDSNLSSHREKISCFWRSSDSMEKLPLSSRWRPQDNATFCYDILTGHLDMLQIAEEQRDAVWEEINAFTRFTPFGLLTSTLLLFRLGILALPSLSRTLRSVIWCVSSPVARFPLLYDHAGTCTLLLERAISTT